MGSFPVSLGVLREELSNIVGVRTGLAWSEMHLDPFISQMTPELWNDGATWIPMRASDFKQLVFSVLHASGDPWTSMGCMPRLSLIMKIEEQRYILAADLLHQEMHRQRLGNDEIGHKEGAHCRLVAPGRDPEVAITKFGYDAIMYDAASLDDRFIAGKYSVIP